MDNVKYIGMDVHKEAMAQYAVVRRNTVTLNGLGISLSGGAAIENVIVLNQLTGLQIFGGVYGSNYFNANGGAPIASFNGVSQNNNSCGGSSC
jgi:hypothetical protein